ncbi:PREDICTED: cactin [Ceratotherium simum simum]|uniref:Splicing factor Cactin n=1 Tax=Ceratotherium simum simum TaxID=73337 RepID=A0ABM1DI04_CERSS|nr:PREDICTED: cactin [Ceratotherium simum simum]
MGRGTRSRSRSAGRRGRRQRSRSGSRSRSRSRSHGQRNRRRRDDEGRRRRRSRERRSDSEEERWQRRGRPSRSPAPRRRRSQDRSSQSDSGDERRQQRGGWAPRRRTRSWSPGSSASSSASPARSRSPGAAAAALSQQQSLQERLRLREERKQQEELRKAFETPEEKRARRLAKKEAKERKKREKMGWGEEYMGYTNTDNPFGDNNLLGTFIWSKALEKKGISHLEEKELKERNKRIQEDNRLELQKVKQLRLEREREKAMREQELEMLQREKEAEHFKTWEEQEDNFHLQQAKLRSKIRIRDGRAKPIDLLAKYISAEDDDLAVEMHEPYTFLNGLTVADMEDLLEDIQVYMELEQGKNADFWRDMTIITEDEIAKLRKLEASGKGPGERREGVNASVSSDVQSVFKGKTYSQLQFIFQGIEGKIQAGGPNLDMGYWESLLQQLRAHMARARSAGGGPRPSGSHLRRGLTQGTGAVSPRPAGPGRGATGQCPCWKAQRAAQEAPRAACPPPSFCRPHTLCVQILSELGRVNTRLLAANCAVASKFILCLACLRPVSARLGRCPHVDTLPPCPRFTRPPAAGDASESAEDIFFRRAKEGMGQDEAQFSVEMPLTGKAYLWADKYRPRKPRFFNRVHTGFEWNKYNQTHYDFDNPPPKIVQGYKFNIFYPDLIDKRATPEYFLEACADSRDFATLRFRAGPPYEDIAFKVVSREWEYSHRHGFRCQFANGIFQLWFHFKRYRYRARSGEPALRETDTPSPGRCRRVDTAGAAGRALRAFPGRPSSSRSAGVQDVSPSTIRSRNRGSLRRPSSHVGTVVFLEATPEPPGLSRVSDGDSLWPDSGQDGPPESDPAPMSAVPRLTLSPGHWSPPSPDFSLGGVARRTARGGVQATPASPGAGGPGTRGQAQVGPPAPAASKATPGPRALPSAEARAATLLLSRPWAGGTRPEPRSPRGLPAGRGAPTDQHQPGRPRGVASAGGGLMRQTDGRREPERSGRRQTARGRQRGPPPGPEGSSRPPTAPSSPGPRAPGHRGRRALRLSPSDVAAPGPLCARPRRDSVSPGAPGRPAPRAPLLPSPCDSAATPAQGPQRSPSITISMPIAR